MVAMEETSVPVVAVTAAVGAIVLLLVMLCGLGRKEEKKENETGIFYRPLHKRVCE